MKTVAIMNLKGGVGKTTTAVNLADILAHYGHRVLLIDADPQANLTAFYGIDGNECATLEDLFNGLATEADDLVQDTAYDGISIVPSGLSLYTSDLSALMSGGTRYKVVKDLTEAAAEEQPLDYCFIDCPPGFSAASVGAIYAADEVLIPTTVDINAIDGVRNIIGQIRSANARARLRVLITKLDRSELSLSGADMLWGSGLPVCETPIRYSKKAQGAMFARMPLREVSRGSITYRTYVLLIDELSKDGWEVNKHGKI